MLALEDLFTKSASINQNAGLHQQHTSSTSSLTLSTHGSEDRGRAVHRCQGEPLTWQGSVHGGTPAPTEEGSTLTRMGVMSVLDP